MFSLVLKSEALIRTAWLTMLCAGAEECSIEDMDDPQKMMENCVVNVCQPGRSLLCSGYVLYSSSTVLVLTIGNGVFGFTLDPLIGEYCLTHDNIKIPETGKIYSFNEGNYQLWSPEVKAYMDSLKKPELWDGKPYSVRSSASSSKSNELILGLFDPVNI